MKKISGFIVLVSSLLLLAFQCGKGDDLVASCVQDKIAAFSSQACPTGAHIKSYYFQSNTVYVFDFGPCGADMAMPVLNNNCDTLGFLGGISGNTMINNQEFSTAEYVGLVWSN
jgi:hypothetical protein